MSSLISEAPEARMVLRNVSWETFVALTDGQYEPIASSIELPGLEAPLIDRFLGQRLQSGETTLIRAFRNAVQ